MVNTDRLDSIRRARVRGFIRDKKSAALAASASIFAAKHALKSSDSAWFTADRCAFFLKNKGERDAQKKILEQCKFRTIMIKKTTAIASKYANEAAISAHWSAVESYKSYHLCIEEVNRVQLLKYEYDEKNKEDEIVNLKMEVASALMTDKERRTYQRKKASKALAFRAKKASGNAAMVSLYAMQSTMKSMHTAQKAIRSKKGKKKITMKKNNRDQEQFIKKKPNNHKQNVVLEKIQDSQKNDSRKKSKTRTGEQLALPVLNNRPKSSRHKNKRRKQKITKTAKKLPKSPRKRAVVRFAQLKIVSS